MFVVAASEPKRRKDEEKGHNSVAHSIPTGENTQKERKMRPKTGSLVKRVNTVFVFDTNPSF